MSNIIKLDNASADAVKRSVNQAKEALASESVPQLNQAENGANGLKYGAVPDIGAVRADASNNAEKLAAFKQAFEDYVDKIESFDQEAASSLRNMAEEHEWNTHSGWSANPVTLDTYMRQRLLDAGHTSQEVNEIMRKYGDALKGLANSTVYVGDPINMSSGNFIYHKEDLHIAGVSPLSFKRFYNAFDHETGVLGLGWTHNYNLYLADQGNSIQIGFEDGHKEYYKKEKDGKYSAPEGSYNSLKKLDDKYILTTKQKTEYHFTTEGNITLIQDANNLSTQFGYKDGLLDSVKSISGSMHFSYTPEGRLCQITDHAGRVIRYEYTNGCLTQAEQPEGRVYQYKYNHEKKMQRVINPAGVTAIRNQYDAHFRTTSQRMPDGGEFAMFYEDETLSTITTEPNGNQITYVRDTGNRTVKIVYADGEEHFDYDVNNNRTMFKDKNGNVYRYAYDKSGNMMRAVDPLNNVTSIAYNDFSKPLLVENPDGSRVRFCYDDQGNLTERADPLERLWKFTYAGNGFPTSISLPDDSIRQYSYDERGNIVSIIHAGGEVTTYEYNELNQVVKSVNAGGHATWFTYNQQGKITKTTNAMGACCAFEYDAYGHLIRTVDYCGQETRFTYTKMGKVERIINAIGAVSRYTYDLMGNVSVYTDPLGNTTRYKYDPGNRLVAVTNPEGGVMRFEHDPCGNITAVVNASGARTTAEYDAMNRVVRQIEPDGAEIHFAYDAFGRLTQTTYPGGGKETREYDKAGQLVAKTNLRGEALRFSYTALGQLEAVISHNGDEVRYEYYPGGRLKAVIKPEGETELYFWDASGNVTKKLDALGYETTMEYDELNRVVQIRNAQGGTKRFCYDPMGRVTALTDANGNATQYRYSPVGTLLEVVDATGHSTHYGFDAARRLTSMEQARMIDPDYGDVVEAELQRTTYEYNKCGQVTTICDPLGNKMQYTYDASGRVITEQDAEGYVTSFAYDQLGQIADVAYADGRSVQFRYGELRQLAEVQDWLGITKIETTASGQITKVTQPDGSTLGYEWNQLGQRCKTIYPDGSEVAYAFDRTGRLTEVQAPGGLTRYSYDEAGCLNRKEMPGKVSTDYSWNNLGRLTQMIHSQNGEVLDSYRYQYDPNGNITQIEKQRAGLEEDSGVFSYSYDGLNRLMSAAHGGQSKHYGYDSCGNRIIAYDGETETRYCYNARNQLIGLQDALGSKEYRYDRRGNLSEVLRGGSVEAQYSYNSANLPEKAFSAQNGLEEYGYDGMCNRISKHLHTQNPEAQLMGTVQPPTEAIRYYVDYLKPYNNLLRMETDGKQGQNFVWGKDLLASEGDISYTYLQDHLGSAIRLVEDTAESTPLAYDEFGVTLVQAGKTQHNPFG